MPRSLFGRLCQQAATLMYWAMLTADTVGPGTVVMCSRAGAEYGLQLLWAVLLAAGVAFSVQESTARLAIVSGKSLGQCLRLKYGSGCVIAETACVCWIIAVAITIGNTLYECNNFAGAVEAALAMPGAQDLVETHGQGFVRVGVCMVCSLVVVLMLCKGSMGRIATTLGAVTFMMGFLFFLSAIMLGFPYMELLQGLVPQFPAKPFAQAADPGKTVLSLVGTTSIGYNVFLGASLANGRSLEESRLGIGFSSSTSFLLSMLVLVNGNRASHLLDGALDQKEYSIQLVARAIGTNLGGIGLVVFSLGFMAAALNCLIAVPLVAGLTVESMFTPSASEVAPQMPPDPVQETASWPYNNPAPSTFGKQIDGISASPEANATLDGGNEQDTRLSGNRDDAVIQSDAEEFAVAGEASQFLSLATSSIKVFVVLVGASVVGLDAPRKKVILFAQSVNGMLLPFYSMCLLLCINDPQLMASRPQAVCDNLRLVPATILTVFLAANVLLEQVILLTLSIPQDQSVTSYSLPMAAFATLVCIMGIGLSTSLVQDVRRSQLT